jgi:hypothetical protein
MRASVRIDRKGLAITTENVAAVTEALLGIYESGAKLWDGAIDGLANSAQMARSVRGNITEVSTSGIKVRIGAGADADWAKGAQFGSNRYRQFPPAVKRGYTAYPALDVIKPEFRTLCKEGIVKALE